MKTAELILNWSVLKSQIGTWTGLSDDTLHAFTGMLILTAAGFLMRRPPWTWRPWLVVLLAETVNELYDLTQTSSPSDENNFPASLHDFWTTMALPTLILLCWPYIARREAGANRTASRIDPAIVVGAGGAALIGLFVTARLG